MAQPYVVRVFVSHVAPGGWQYQTSRDIPCQTVDEIRRELTTLGPSVGDCVLFVRSRAAAERIGSVDARALGRLGLGPGQVVGDGMEYEPESEQPAYVQELRARSLTTVPPTAF